MANHEMPRRGSAAANGLVTVHTLGGVVRISGWMKVAGWKGTLTQFRVNVMDRLARAGLICVEDDLCIITDQGRKFLGVAVKTEKVVALAAGPRSAASTQPLNMARHYPKGMVRPGSLDYRDIPSLIGGHRIEYRSGVGAIDA